MRHLRLVGTKEKDMTVKIAFASSDRRAVNQHFGAAEAFAIYEVDEGTLIDELLLGLQKSMLNDPPVWLAKHLKKQSHAGSFADDEEWQE